MTSLHSQSNVGTQGITLHVVCDDTLTCSTDMPVFAQKWLEDADSVAGNPAQTLQMVRAEKSAQAASAAAVTAATQSIASPPPPSTGVPMRLNTATIDDVSVLCPI